MKKRNSSNLHHYDGDQAVVFISDIHLDSHQDPLCCVLRDFLDTHSHSAAAIYILGDLFDFWAGDLCSLRYQPVLEHLKKSARNCPIYFMPGNRDFLIKSSLLQQFDIQKISDPTILTCGKRRVALTHGDQLCVRDSGYQRMRMILQNPLSRWIIQLLPYSFCLWFSKRLRHQSKKSTGKKLPLSMQACLETTTQWLNRFSCHAIIYGHVHCLEHKKTRSLPAKDIYVLDSWEHVPNFCLLTQDETILSPAIGNAVKSHQPINLY